MGGREGADRARDQRRHHALISTSHTTPRVPLSALDAFALASAAVERVLSTNGIAHPRLRERTILAAARCAQRVGTAEFNDAMVVTIANE